MPQIWNGGYPAATALFPSICSTQGVPLGPLIVSLVLTKKTMLSVPLETNAGAMKLMDGEAVPLLVALKLALPSKTNSTPFVPSGAAGRSVTAP